MVDYFHGFTPLPLPLLVYGCFISGSRLATLRHYPIFNSGQILEVFYFRRKRPEKPHPILALYLIHGGALCIAFFPC